MDMVLLVSETSDCWEYDLIPVISLAQFSLHFPTHTANVYSVETVHCTQSSSKLLYVLLRIPIVMISAVAVGAGLICIRLLRQR
jgi:hypothetical protein